MSQSSKNVGNFAKKYLPNKIIKVCLDILLYISKRSEVKKIRKQGGKTKMIVWKPIRGYEGRYLVSNKGDIMSCYSGKLLSPTNDECGYEMVRLTNEFGKKSHLVHRLVAHAFIPKPKGINEINHINEIKNDNRVENLEWVSQMKTCKSIGITTPKRKARQNNRERRMIIRTKTLFKSIYLMM